MVATVAAASRSVNSHRRCPSHTSISRCSSGVYVESMSKPLLGIRPGSYNNSAAQRPPRLSRSTSRHRRVNAPLAAGRWSRWLDDTLTHSPLPPKMVENLGVVADILTEPLLSLSPRPQSESG